MTVEQLIERLKCYPQDAKVYFRKDEIDQLWWNEIEKLKYKPGVILEPK